MNTRGLVVRSCAVALVAALHLSCCCRPPAVPKDPGIYSGCTYGAPLVKVLVQLEKSCRVQVTPASVCVQPGGTIQFRIESDCANAPQIQITQPRLKSLPPGAVEPPPQRHKDADLLTGCNLAIKTARAQNAPVLSVCRVAEGAAVGFYKYDVTGDGFAPLDPDVEIRPPKNQ